MKTEDKIYQKKFFADIVTTVYSDLFASQYNAAVDSILSDSKLQKEFNTILDEQKAVCIDRGMSEADAEKYVCKPDNLRRAVMFFIKNF